jgi:hypothetical protein
VKLIGANGAMSHTQQIDLKIIHIYKPIRQIF